MHTIEVFDNDGKRVGVDFAPDCEKSYELGKNIAYQFDPKLFSSFTDEWFLKHYSLGEVLETNLDVGEYNLEDMKHGFYKIMKDRQIENNCVEYFKQFMDK